MGLYDSFTGNETIKEGECEYKITAQLKCLGCALNLYEIGDNVPVAKHGFPSTCTFCDWGGTSEKYKSINVLGELYKSGTFIVVENGKLVAVTHDESKVKTPVFDKYGNSLEEQKILK